jgi:O-antigen ligase
MNNYIKKNKIIVLISYKNIGLFLLGCLFFLSLFVPTRYQQIKVVFLALGLIFLLIDLKKLIIHRYVLLWIVLMIMSDIFFQFIGLINKGSGAIRVSTITILWPICYIVIISALNKIFYFDKIIKILIVSTWVIIIHTFILIYSSLYMINTPFSEIDVGYIIGFYDSFIEYTTYNMGSLVFIVPFTLTLWITQLDKDYFSKWGYYSMCFLLLILVLISGRTAFQLNLVFLIIISLLIGKLFLDIDFKIHKLFIGLLFFLPLSLYIVNYFYTIDINSIFSDIQNKFDFTSSSNSSGYERGEQFRELMKYWEKRPLLGWGLGVGVKTSVRSFTQDWAYELTYIARLFQTGIVGSILYISYIMWIVYRCLVIIKKKTYLSKITYSVLNGFICFFIANATNPYLGKFDHMWVLYLPLALINYDLLSTANYKFQTLK